MKQALGLDLDGVLYPWHMALYHEQVIYSGETRDYYTFWKNYADYKNFTWWDNIVKLEHLYSNQVPSRELVSLLHELDKVYNIYYVTNRPKEVEFATRQFMKKYDFPRQEHLIFTKNKVEVCNSLSIKIFVEDRIENVLALLKNGTYVYVVKQPWNEDCQFPQSPERVVNSFLDMKGRLL